MHASLKGQVKVVELLIEKGAEVNLGNIWTDGPLLCRQAKPRTGEGCETAY